MSKQILELRRKRAALIQKARHIVDIADQEERGRTEQEQRDYDQFMAEIETLNGDIQTRENLERMERDLGRPLEEPNRPAPEDSPEIGMSRRDLENYRLTRAIMAAAAHAQGNSRAWDGARLELEASQATAERLGMQPQGFYVPYDWIRSQRPRERRALQEQRDLNVGTGSAGGDLVATDLLASSFIELLRNRLVLQAAGMMVLDGLVGDVAIPRQTGGATAYWVGEGGAPTESQQTVDQAPLTPHTVGAFTDFTRKLLKQSSISVEGFVRSDLAAVLALAIDYAGLHGDSGVDANQPDGVETYADVTSVVGGANGAAPDWADVVNLETAVAQNNADVGRLAYITNTKVRGKLKQTEKATGTAMFVWGDDQRTPLNGYAGHVTNQVRSNRAKGDGTNLSTIFFGNWADLVLGMWGGLDILVDPYTHSTSGTIRVVALQDVDFAVRHDASFAAMLDAITA